MLYQGKLLQTVRTLLSFPHLVEGLHIFFIPERIFCDQGHAARCSHFAEYAGFKSQPEIGHFIGEFFVLMSEIVNDNQQSVFSQEPGCRLNDLRRI